MQKIEPAVAFDVEDQIEFPRFFVGEKVAALHTGGVQKHVDAAAARAHLVDNLGDGVGILKIDTEIVRRAARCFDGIDRAPGGLRSLQGR